MLLNHRGGVDLFHGDWSVRHVCWLYGSWWILHPADFCSPSSGRVSLATSLWVYVLSYTRCHAKLCKEAMLRYFIYYYYCFYYYYFRFRTSFNRRSRWPTLTKPSCIVRTLSVSSWANVSVGKTSSVKAGSPATSLPARSWIGGGAKNTNCELKKKKNKNKSDYSFHL